MDKNEPIPVEERVVISWGRKQRFIGKYETWLRDFPRAKKPKKVETLESYKKRIKPLNDEYGHK
jgi:uncharacterized protein YifE (UPF0438 family)